MDGRADVGVLSARLLFAFQDEMFRRLAEQGHPDLRPRHGLVLAHLDADGSRASELAVGSGQHKQVIGTTVDELERLGYVERRPDPTDRRAKLVVPTARGLDQMARARTIVADLESHYRDAVGTDRFDDFIAAFSAVVAVATAER
ncbi:MarR family transcriptional regulator [Nakamurella sp. YIM 132087]|uniref:MarR family transcriptional regulator n=1 Tax=Nakamurella alba TaxID=2665158 RepID=A0A7K1FJM4_9ACTN|nr:MarR family winged helix-turn-helix transcriptional regulator [Nakamurella alba]MTD14270.1 MarR family transcriptional regulator [Nakamurella alba]